jgi:predicted ATPase
VRRDLPAGTVTFLFTDIQGSTMLLRQLGAEAYAQALAEHRRILREAFTAEGGVEVDTQGDAFFVAFPTAQGAVRAAAEALEGLAAGPIRVRIGIHTGTPHVSDEGYVGSDVHRAARIAACGHGSQVLVSSSTAALVGTDGLRDLGLHRLKDLSAPERIYQLGNVDFPPLKTLHQTNLPIPSTPFLGRGAELAQVHGLLSQDDVRLLTLTGPGGTGKTRLALHTAGALADSYVHGVWWVPLAALRDPRLVLEMVAHALGARNGLAEHIADRSMLLLLDNFEQVSEAAADVAALLASCPNLDLLVTSREPLHITGEQQYAVLPLAPDEGVALFVARARAVEPSFQADAAVAEICRRLDDLPLALELAAARVKTLSPPQMLARLDRRLPLLTGGARDLPERQRTLRAAIEWSHDLLTPDEQRLFARLAVFRGGCALDAVEGVIGADLDQLTSLVDKSLLRHRDDRFWMLETIREYAAERLESSGDAGELRRRHADHFLALAEEADRRLWQGSPGEWLDRLDAELDNARAALDRLEMSGETQLAMRFAGALWRFWNMRGHLVEGRRRLVRALAADERPTAARAGALIGASSMAARSGDSASARTWAEEALALNLKLGDALGVALSQSYLATAAAQERDWAKARGIIEECVRAFRELGDEDNALLATWVLAWIYRELGDHERSRALTEENLRQARAAGYRRIEALSLGALAMLSVDQGRLQDGLAGLKEAYRIDRAYGYPLQVALDLCLFARALARAGNWRAAAQLFAKGEALREETGESLGSWSVIEAKLEDTRTAIRAHLDEAAFAEAWEQGRALSLDDAVALALDPGE